MGHAHAPAYIKGNYDPGVTNYQERQFAHWRRWLGPTSRCVGRARSRPLPNQIRRAGVRGRARTPNAWFARDADRPLMFFAGFWTPWKGVKEGPRRRTRIRALRVPHDVTQ